MVFLINVSKCKNATAPRRTGKAEETLLGRGTIDSGGGPCAVPQTVPSGPNFFPRMFRGTIFLPRTFRGDALLGGPIFV